MKARSSTDWLIFLLLTIPGILLAGWAMTLMWLWFVAPVFDVRAITVGEAIGLSITVGLVRSTNYDPNRTISGQMGASILGVLLALGMGALLHYGFGVGGPGGLG